VLGVVLEGFPVFLGGFFNGFVEQPLMCFKLEWL